MSLSVLPGGLMNRVLKYEVIEASSLDRLVDEVQQRIDGGWQPLSGPFYLNGSHFQAVVWTEESADAARLPTDERAFYQSEIELIDELTEDDQPISRWEVGVDDGRTGSRR
jgi:hypothetical protein